MSKLHRPILPDAYYFITRTTYRRVSWFAEPAYAQIVVDQWQHYKLAYEFTLDAYCVMPDHYHVVLNVGQKKTISQILHAVDSYIVTQISAAGNLSPKPKTWEGRPWDEVIRDEEMYWQKVAYTLLNPWRARLVSDPLDLYPFSNLGDWIEREGKEFVLDLFSRYKRWVE